VRKPHGDFALRSVLPQIRAQSNRAGIRLAVACLIRIAEKLLIEFKGLGALRRVERGLPLPGLIVLFNDFAAGLPQKVDPPVRGIAGAVAELESVYAFVLIGNLRAVV